MKKVIRCDETMIYSIQKHDYIRFVFVSDNNNTVSEFKLKVGDRDPFTGEEITSEIIQEYTRIHNHEVYRNLRIMATPYKKAEREARQAERVEIARELERKYHDGWGPDTVEYILEQRWGDRNNVHYDAMFDLDDESYTDPLLPTPCNDIESQLFGDDDTFLLRDFAATLSGRLLDVYQLILDRAAKRKGRQTAEAVAAKWNVTRFTVLNDQKRLKAMIAEYFLKHSPNFAKWYPNYKASPALRIEAKKPE